MYKRPNLNKQEKIHPIEEEFRHYGFIDTTKDAGWISPHLIELHDESRFALHQFSSTIDSAKTINMSDFKPEIAAQKREQLILKSKRALMSFLKKHLEKYKSEINAVENKILRQTEPNMASDPTKALLVELKNQEIRTIVRNTEPKRRYELVKDNLEFIKALVGAPDNIINKEQLMEIRRNFTFKQDPTLKEELDDQQTIYKSVRARAAEISATAAKMLIYAKIDDPLPPAEHFEVFTPETDHEASYAARRIQSWQKTQDRIAKDKAFEEKNTEVNLEIRERVERLRRI